jgi:hypothetical protein
VRLPGNGKPGDGPLTLRLRDVDMADLFFAIHRLTGESFVVDGDVSGRVSVDLLGVTLDAALARLADVDVGVSAAGGVRRVSRLAAPRRTWPAVSEGPPASFTVKRADVRQLLVGMTEAQPGLACLGPAGFLGRVSLWTRDIPLLDLRAAMLDAVGLAEEVEGGQRLLKRPTGTEELTPVTDASRPQRLALAPDALTPLEFDLVGVGRVGGAWLAFAYDPGGTLNGYTVGSQLDTGAVDGINDSDVMLQTEDGPLRVPLASLR